MGFDLLPFFLDNLEAAGFIGGYVSISIIGVALITLASRGKVEQVSQLGPKWAQPIIGTFLGVIPGCGGTIVASSLYKSRKLSFGGLFAAFTTTLGDGSFVLLGASDEADVSANLAAFFILNAVGLTMGVILGSAVDAFGIRAQSDEVLSESLQSVHEKDEDENSLSPNILTSFGFYTILLMSIFLAPSSIMALWGGGIDALEEFTIWVAIALTVVSSLYYFTNKFMSDDHDCAFRSGVKETLMHSVADIAMVIFYVFIGLFVANFIIDVLVGAETFDRWMTSSAFIVVILAAFIGFAPGCGGMIAVAVAYITIKDFPMAALIAAGIATSGDGVFPLLAENRKDGILVSLAGLVAAVAVGLLALTIGV